MICHFYGNCKAEVFFGGGGEWALSKLDSEKRSRHPSGAQFSNQKSVVETLIVIQIKEVFLCCCCCCCVLLPEVHLYRSLCAAVDLGVYFSARYPWNDVHVVGEGKSKVALHGRVVRGRAALWTFIHEARAHNRDLDLEYGGSASSSNRSACLSRNTFGCSESHL